MALHHGVDPPVLVMRRLLVLTLRGGLVPLLPSFHRSPSPLRLAQRREPDPLPNAGA